MPDCAPSQVDGQRGLATFLQLIYSLAGALIVWVVAAIAFSVLFLKRLARKSKGQPTP
jgi:hypothetical protein